MKTWIFDTMVFVTIETWMVTNTIVFKIQDRQNVRTEDPELQLA